MLSKFVVDFWGADVDTGVGLRARLLVQHKEAFASLDPDGRDQPFALRRAPARQELPGSTRTDCLGYFLIGRKHLKTPP